MSLNLFPGCNTFCNHNKKMTLTDRKGGRSKYIVRNRNAKKMDCYLIDGCIKSKEKKCDYLLLNLSDTIAFLIELKGSDLHKAILQIDATLSMVIKKLNGFRINARIILTKVCTPSIKSTSYIKLKKRISSVGGDLKQRSNNYFEEIL